MVVAQIQVAIEIVFMSIALGMDAFSLSIGVGLQGVVRRRALQLCIFVGLFHIAFTILGFYVGILLGGFLGKIAGWFGAALLVGLGLHMGYTSLSAEPEQIRPLTTTAMMLLFSAGVSFDALSVGFTLGLRSTAYCIASALTFGAMGSLMCALGLFIGKRATKFMGTFGEILGAVILVVCGIHFLFE